MQVWINSSGKTLGPYSISQVEEYLNLGNFSINDFYCDIGGNKWISLAKLFPVQSAESSSHFTVVNQPTASTQEVTTKTIQDAGKSEVVDYELSFRKSWTAYIAPSVLVFIFVLPLFTIPLTIIPFIWILSIRKYKMYTNESGVWISYGLFPWTKGFSGVKWRDLNECILVNNFLSWMLRSYTIVVSHRYTKRL